MTTKYDMSAARFDEIPTWRSRTRSQARATSAAISATATATSVVPETSRLVIQTIVT